MSIEIKMPALSPTMEEGTLAKWLVKEGDTVKSGDLMAEIETDKATMEFEAVDEGVIGRILVPEGTDNVKVGTVIAVLDGENTRSSVAAPAPAKPAPKAEAPPPAPFTRSGARPSERRRRTNGRSIKASPLARRIAAEQGRRPRRGVSGSGPNGRIVKADLEGASPAPHPRLSPPPLPRPRRPLPRRPPSTSRSGTMRASRTRSRSSRTSARRSRAA